MRLPAVAVAAAAAAAAAACAGHGLASAPAAPTVPGLLAALERLLLFLEQQPGSVTGNMLLCLSMVAGQLHTFHFMLVTNIYNLKIPRPLRRSLGRRVKTLEWMCEGILEAYQNQTSDFLLHALARPALWRADEPRVRRPLEPPLEPPPELPLRLMIGEPSGPVSDRCLGELAGETGPRCAVSAVCRHAELGPVRGVSGYPLTHRVLWARSARQLGCRQLWVDERLAERMRGLCTNILLEAQVIELHGFPLHMRDLFAEQVAFCGIEGFREFAKAEWLEAILSWQRPEGCFGDFEEYSKFMEQVDNPRRVAGSGRRGSPEHSDQFGCMPHFTAVGAVALAASLRSLVEHEAPRQADPVQLLGLGASAAASLLLLLELHRRRRLMSGPPAS